jgi:hypothetical protein
MSKTLSVAQMLANLEARAAFHQERRSFHAEKKAHHHEQLALHDAELRKTRERLEAFKAAAEAASELAAPPSAPEEDRAKEEIAYFGKRPMLSRLVARVVDSQPAGEVFGARVIAAEVNRRYREVVKKPVQPRTVSVVLRRLEIARRIRQTRPGKALYEALYVRDAI